MAGGREGKTACYQSATKMKRIGNNDQKKRFIEPPFRGQKGRCQWCGTHDIPKGRRSWCSQECVEEYLLRSSGEHIRQAVYRRDKGVCAICGRDADTEYRAWREQHKEIYRLADRLFQSSRFNQTWERGKWRLAGNDEPLWGDLGPFRKYLLDKYAPGRWTPGRQSGWDADHIIPVVEGGGGCGIDGMRTLCHPCHKDQTAALAARRARNPAQQTLDLPCG